MALDSYENWAGVEAETGAHVCGGEDMSSGRGEEPDPSSRK